LKTRTLPLYENVIGSSRYLSVLDFLVKFYLIFSL